MKDFTNKIVGEAPKVKAKPVSKKTTTSLDKNKRAIYNETTNEWHVVIDDITYPLSWIPKDRFPVLYSLPKNERRPAWTGVMFDNKDKTDKQIEAILEWWAPVYHNQRIEVEIKDKIAYVII